MLLLYALPCAALTVALATVTWRCRRLARALAAERLTARLDQQTWAADIAALQHHHRTTTAPSTSYTPSTHENETAVLAAAHAVIDAALAATGTDLPRGGTDG